ncbi:MAG: hypothetical protein U9O94_02265, partial [Nanoarchaeota archaeon]|nr:hypothetical protein [Nanoarchaeota archaeon]
SLDSAYQRYVGTVAFMSSPSSICHLFCTHCQRDKDKGSTKSAKKGDNALEYIAQNENAREILITGGDALALGKDQLEYILKTLSSIKHVESIRIASRLPVTNPFAVTYEKLEMIARYSKHAPGNSNDLPNIYFVTHANAPEQLTEDMQDSVSRIIQYPFSGIFNQTVLLNGVNDDFSRISKLFQGLHNMGVKPYYLFQCHKVEGLATQIVPIYLGQSFIAQLRGQPGMSIPAYVVNMVGGGGKVPLTPEGNGEIEIFEYEQSKLLRGHDGEIKRYEDLLKVRERDYGEGMAAMAEFYGDPSIRDCTEGPSVNGLNTRETVSRKFRPSIIVVSDTNPDQVLYVTNVPTKTFMAQADKYKAMGFVPNGPEFGLEEKFPTNPHHAILK